MVDRGNEQHVHHWVMYECDSDFESQYLANNTWPEPGPCFQLDPTQDARVWMKVRPFCSKISLVWAVGGDMVQDFPSNLAYPIGGSTNRVKYFIIEMHYDNPELKQSKFKIKSFLNFSK
jgi:hypothetical protein